MSEVTLTTTQRAILTHAIEHTQGKLDWFPEGIKGGARNKVLYAMQSRQLVYGDGTNWFVTPAGIEALGSHPAPATPADGTHANADVDAANYDPQDVHDEPPHTALNSNRASAPCPDLEADVAACEARWGQEQTESAIPVAEGTTASARTRDNSKQAEVIRMLRRPEGATIAQISAATGWQQHTVRGTFAGALKKKLGLTIISDKQQGGERIYRIA